MHVRNPSHAETPTHAKEGPLILANNAFKFGHKNIDHLKDVKSGQKRRDTEDTLH